MHHRSACHDELIVDPLALSGAGSNRIAADPVVAAIRAIRMPVVITNPYFPDNPVVFANEAFCAFSGYAREEILGRNCRFLQGPETDPATVKLVREAVQRAEPIEIDIRNHRKDGTAFWNRLLLAPVSDMEGVLAYFVAVQIDVTAEHQQLDNLEAGKALLANARVDRQQMLQDHKREMAFTLRAAQLGGWQLDTRSEHLSASDTLRDMLGRPADQPFSHEDLLNAIHPEDRAKTMTEVRSWSAQREGHEVVCRIKRPDGEIRWIELRGQPFFDATGVAERISGVAIDLTDHCRNDFMRAALVDLRNVFRDVTQPNDILFAAAEIIGRTLRVNRVGHGEFDAKAETTSFEPEWRASEIAPAIDEVRLAIPLGVIETLRRGDDVIVEDARADVRTAATADGLEAIGTRAFIIAPLMERGGLAAFVYLTDETCRHWRNDEIAFVREVAERSRIAVKGRRGEQELASLAASLEQDVATRTSELRAAEDALRQAQKMEAIGQLTGGVAHDFNNLLTVIRSATDLLKRPGLSAERRARYIDAISDTTDRAAKLTGQLLAFARRQALKPQIIDVGRNLVALSDMLGTLTGSRIVMSIDVPDSPCFTDVDRNQLDTALVNMAVNARDAMDGAGRIALKVRSVSSVPPIRTHPAMPGNFVAISMDDTGAGIAPEELDRIFEPFFTTKRVGEGTGLGLSQVFGFVKQSGGNIAVESRVGQGTSFTLYLPAADRVANPEMNEVTEPFADGRGVRILVVEDNVDLGVFTAQSLEEVGYETVLAEDAQGALSELAKDNTRFDIVFSDVVMPGLSGIELAQAIRAKYPNLAVLLTSGYSDVLAQNGTHGFELLHKPYSIEQLTRALQKAGDANRIALQNVGKASAS